MDFEFYCSLFSRYGLEITEEKYEKFEKYSAFLVEYNQKVNLTAITDPQEIVDLCLYLASEKGQFINGENIMIDGGRNAMGRWKE